MRVRTNQICGVRVRRQSMRIRNTVFQNGLEPVLIQQILIGFEAIVEIFLPYRTHRRHKNPQACQQETFA